MKNYTIARKLDDVYMLAERTVRDFTELHEHEYGQIYVKEVKMDREYDYLDVTVSSDNDAMGLAHFLSPLAPTLRKRIADSIQLRKVPKIRFRVQKPDADITRVLDILTELEHTYDLTK